MMPQQFLDDAHNCWQFIFVSSDSAEKKNLTTDKTRKFPALNLQVPTAKSLRNRMLYQQVIRIVAQEIWER